MTRPDDSAWSSPTRAIGGGQHATPTETSIPWEDLSAWAAWQPVEGCAAAGQARVRAGDRRSVKTIYRVFDSTARGKAPAPADLQAYET